MGSEGRARKNWPGASPAAAGPSPLPLTEVADWDAVARSRPRAATADSHALKNVEATRLSIAQSDGGRCAAPSHARATTAVFLAVGAGAGLVDADRITILRENGVRVLKVACGGSEDDGGSGRS
ncbi:hypothetical protein VTO73DRAFT_653 [Trametes versicolor]